MMAPNGLIKTPGKSLGGVCNAFKLHRPVMPGRFPASGRRAARGAPWEKEVAAPSLAAVTSCVRDLLASADPAQCSALQWQQALTHCYTLVNSVEAGSHGCEVTWAAKLYEAVRNLLAGHTEAVGKTLR